MTDIEKKDYFELNASTGAVRRNLLIASSVAFFIGWTRALPTEISFLGLKFLDDQKEAISWAIFGVTVYFFLHFLASACVELSVFLKPKAFFRAYKKDLLTHPAFDETVWMDIGPPADPHNLDEVQEEARRDAKYAAERAVRPLENMVYVKLAIDVVFPLVFPLVALSYLLYAILS